METLTVSKPTKKARMYAQILQHGENLNAIFNTGLEPVKLCKKLHTLEHKITVLTTDYCNTGNQHEEEIEVLKTKVLNLLFKNLKNEGELYDSIFINLDPRGYALKIDDKYVREKQLSIHTDMGGYGILSPEFNGN